MSIVFLFLDNNIKTYRINSGALIWEKQIGDNNIVAAENTLNDKNVFFIKKYSPNKEIYFSSNTDLDASAYKKAIKYSIVSMDKRDGNILWDVPLDVPSKSKIIWIYRNK